MPSPRWLATLAIPMMAGAALVSSAAIATANTPADDAYLAKLRAVGLTLPPQSEEALIGEADFAALPIGRPLSGVKALEIVHGEQ